MNDEMTSYTLESAWKRLDHVFSAIRALFGTAAKIAAGLIMRRETQLEFLKWLAPAEGVARRLLLLEALKRPPPKPRAPSRAKGRTVNLSAYNPDPVLSENPDDWRVSFYLGVGSPRRRAAHGAAKRAPAYDNVFGLNAAPFARRLEAFHRMLCDREAYVKRLVRRIHANLDRTRQVFAYWRKRAFVAKYLVDWVQPQTDLALARLDSG